MEGFDFDAFQRSACDGYPQLSSLSKSKSYVYDIGVGHNAYGGLFAWIRLFSKICIFRSHYVKGMCLEAVPLTEIAQFPSPKLDSGEAVPSKWKTSFLSGRLTVSRCYVFVAAYGHDSNIIPPTSLLPQWPFVFIGCSIPNISNMP